MDALFEYLLKALVYAVRVTMHWPKIAGSGQWPLTNATVTAPPRISEGLGCPTAEIVYSFRVNGELYTGLHEEAFLSTDSMTDYIERFTEGRHVVVLVKPNNPEVSVVCEEDQGALSQNQQLMS
jgi:uncharacterized protein DUF3592